MAQVDRTIARRIGRRSSTIHDILRSPWGCALYKRLLLASDGTQASLVALREGVLIAKSFDAAAHLLIIDPETPAVRIAEGYYPLSLPAKGQELLDLGLSRLKHVGVKATGELLRGDPLQLITERVRKLEIDLIVLGHQRRSFLNRWWSGPGGGYIVDNVPCGVLVARERLTDEAFNRHSAMALIA